MSFSYEYPRPALTVDCVVFGLHEGSLWILLIERALPPFEGQWALPGGFVHMDETLEAAARRELEEEAGLRTLYLEQLYTFGAVNRDPRDRVVSVAYFALVNRVEHPARAASDARNAAWFSLDAVPPLAFDHQHILDVAVARLQAKVQYQPVGFELLPAQFTLSELQSLYETILRRPLDKRNFRKKVLSLGFVVPTKATQQGVAHRAARLYRFDEAKYRKAERAGHSFQLG